MTYKRLGVRLSRPDQEPMASILLSTRANSPQHNTRIVPFSSCVEGKPAVKPCSYRPSPSYVLSRPRASLTPHSCVPPDLSLTSYRTTVPPLGRGLLAQNPGRQGFCRLGMPGSPVVIVVVITKMHFFLVGLKMQKHREKPQGAITYWENLSLIPI